MTYAEVWVRVYAAAVAANYTWPSDKADEAVKAYKQREDKGEFEQ